MRLGQRREPLEHRPVERQQPAVGQVGLSQERSDDEIFKLELGFDVGVGAAGRARGDRLAQAEDVRAEGGVRLADIAKDDVGAAWGRRWTQAASVAPKKERLPP